jgi:hypothetical protein
MIEPTNRAAERYRRGDIAASRAEAFATLARDHPDALFVASDPLITSRRACEAISLSGFISNKIVLVFRINPQALLVNPANATNTESTLRDTADAARTLGLQIQVLNAGSIREIDAAFAALVRERADALFVGPESFFTSRRVQLATLSARNAVGVPTALLYRADDVIE